MITAEVTDHGIYLNALVSKPGATGPEGAASIRFLIVSGSRITMIQPIDRAALTPVFPDLDQAPMVDHPAWPNMGGTALLRRAPATLAFQGMDEDGRQQVWHYDTVLYVAEPTEHNAQLPSVLGLDILSHWRWQLQIGQGLAQFAPI